MQSAFQEAAIDVVGLPNRRGSAHLGRYSPLRFCSNASCFDLDQQRHRENGRLRDKRHLCSRVMQPLAQLLSKHWAALRNIPRLQATGSTESVDSESVKG